MEYEKKTNKNAKQNSHNIKIQNQSDMILLNKIKLSAIRVMPLNTSITSNTMDSK